jgi:hypothetical protein
MTELGVSLMGSNVLKKTRESSVCLALHSSCPTGATVQLKKSCGRAYHRRPSPLRSMSVLTLNWSAVLGPYGYGATRQTQSCGLWEMIRYLDIYHSIYHDIYHDTYHVIYHDIYYGIYYGIYSVMNTWLDFVLENYVLANQMDSNEPLACPYNFHIPIEESSMSSDVPHICSGLLQGCCSVLRL